MEWQKARYSKLMESFTRRQRVKAARMRKTRMESEKLRIDMEEILDRQRAWEEYHDSQEWDDSKAEACI